MKLCYEPFSFMWICLHFGRPHGHHSLALNSTDYWNDCIILTLEVGLHTDFVLKSWQVGCSLKCNTCTMQVIARKTQGWKQLVFTNSDDSHWLTLPVVSLSLVPLWKIPPNPETQKCGMSRWTDIYQILCNKVRTLWRGLSYLLLKPQTESSPYNILICIKGTFLYLKGRWPT